MSELRAKLKETELQLVENEMRRGEYMLQQLQKRWVYEAYEVNGKVKLRRWPFHERCLELIGRWRGRVRLHCFLPSRATQHPKSGLPVKQARAEYQGAAVVKHPYGFTPGHVVDPASNEIVVDLNRREEGDLKGIPEPIDRIRFYKGDGKTGRYLIQAEYIERRLRLTHTLRVKFLNVVGWQALIMTRSLSRWKLASQSSIGKSSFETALFTQEHDKQMRIKLVVAEMSDMMQMQATTMFGKILVGWQYYGTGRNIRNWLVNMFTDHAIHVTATLRQEAVDANDAAAGERRSMAQVREMSREQMAAKHVEYTQRFDERSREAGGINYYHIWTGMTALKRLCCSYIINYYHIWTGMTALKRIMGGYHSTGNLQRVRQWRLNQRDRKAEEDMRETQAAHACASDDARKARLFGEGGKVLGALLRAMNRQGCGAAVAGFKYRFGSYSKQTHLMLVFRLLAARYRDMRLADLVTAWRLTMKQDFNDIHCGQEVAGTKIASGHSVVRNIARTWQNLEVVAFWRKMKDAWQGAVLTPVDAILTLFNAV